MMIEEIILDFLNNQADIPAYMEVPEKITGFPFLVVQKTGSSEENHIKRAVIAVQSYAVSLYEAAKVNDRIKDIMLELITLDSISKCSLNSDYNFTDTANKRYRYQAVFDITHY